jgi:hypothetical protein
MKNIRHWVPKEQHCVWVKICLFQIVIEVIGAYQTATIRHIRVAEYISQLSTRNKCLWSTHNFH